MANEVMGTLFGVTPEALMAQRENQLQQRALQFAQLDPLQQAQMGFYTAGSRLGTAIGGLLGAEDPELMRVRQRQSLLQDIDPNDPSSLKAKASEFLAANDFTAASALSRQALELEAKQASIKKDLAAAGRERQQAIPADIQKANAVAELRQAVRTLEAQPASPERDMTLQSYKDRLSVLDKAPATALSDLGKLLAERDALGPNADPATIKAYNDKINKLTTGKTMGQELGEGLATGFGMRGKALGPALKKEGEGIGEFSAKDFNTLGSAVAAGTSSKRNIGVLKNAMQNAFTGKFSDVKEGFITGLEGLGINVGPELRQAASNTQLVNAMGTRYVFPLVKNFPGSLAAKELERLEKTAPNSLQQPETIITLMNLLEQDLAENEYAYNRAKDYKQKNQGSAIGFNQADARIEFQNKLTTLKTKISSARRAGTMTKQQRDEINALKSELGVQ